MISEWLIEAKADKEIKAHTYELDGYKYSFVPSYKDVEVSFIYSKDQGSLKQRFIKGTSEDEVFVKIKFNLLYAVAPIFMKRMIVKIISTIKED